MRTACHAGPPATIPWRVVTLGPRRGTAANQTRMLFNSVQFLVFFPLVVLLHFACPHRYRWVVLLAASFYFYLCWEAVVEDEEAPPRPPARKNPG